MWSRMSLKIVLILYMSCQWAIAQQFMEDNFGIGRIQELAPQADFAITDAFKFFNKCISIRDANNFVNHNEDLHHPLQNLPTMPEYEDDPPVDQPHELREPKFVAESVNCTEYKCMVQNLERDPHQIARMACTEQGHCVPQISGMQCRGNPESYRHSFCECPRGYAYNATACQCQRALQCWNHMGDCHNGMKCRNSKCSCIDFAEQLFDPHSGFCVEPDKDAKGRIYDNYRSNDQGAGSSNANMVQIIIVSILAVVVFTILLGIAIYLGHQHANGLLCQRGDYHCEADETDRTKKKAINIGGARRPKRQLSSADLPHVAAWDMDSLDEEQAIKYVHRSPMDSKKSGAGAGSVGTGATTASTVEAIDMINTSISSSRASLNVAGSLPESEQPTESRPVKPRSRSHSRNNSVDLRFNPVFQTPVDLEPGGRAYDSVTTSSDIL